MFTGIIESMATVVKVEKNKGNLDISLKSEITNELKIDQSLCHNGVCLTVVDIDCLLYTSPSPRDATLSRMPSSA